MPRVMVVELGLHDDRPDIHANIENDDGPQANLGPATLAEVLHVKDKPEAKATDTSVGQTRLANKIGME